MCEKDDSYDLDEDFRSDVTCFMSGLDVPQKNATINNKIKFIAQEKI